MSHATTARDDASREMAASRYELLIKIASGGMATVYVGRMRGGAGFTRLVAIKRAHPHLLENADFRRLLIEEARLASKVRHPHAIAVLDVEELDDELLLVMDYVQGASLADLQLACAPRSGVLPARAAVRIALDVCAGLHAAHAACDDDGRPLGLVHQDVSPHNVLVGVDGISRLTDFGIAKCASSSDRRGGSEVLRGKLGYMAPEYVVDGRVDARGDVFSLGVVLWEALTGRRLFRAGSDVATMRAVTSEAAVRVSALSPELGSALDAVVAKALSKAPADRFDSADELAAALEHAARSGNLIGSHDEVGALVREIFAEPLERRRQLLRARIEQRDQAAGRLPRRTGAEDVADARTSETPREASTLDHGTVAGLQSRAAGGGRLLRWGGLAALAFGAATAALVLPSYLTRPAPSALGSGASTMEPARRIDEPRHALSSAARRTSDAPGGSATAVPLALSAMPNASAGPAPPRLPTDRKR